jgi:hypothetical protein
MIKKYMIIYELYSFRQFFVDIFAPMIFTVVSSFAEPEPQMSLIIWSEPELEP